MSDVAVLLTRDYKFRAELISPEVQVFNHHLPAPNLYCDYHYPSPKYLTIGYTWTLRVLGDLGFGVEDLGVWGVEGLGIPHAQENGIVSKAPAVTRMVGVLSHTS